MKFVISASHRSFIFPSISPLSLISSFSLSRFSLSLSHFISVAMFSSNQFALAQITNTDKIKKMSRKQLRLVRKMDTNPSAAKHATKNSKMK